MGMEDFINLDASKDSDPKDENNDSQNVNFTPTETQCKFTSKINNVGPNGSNIQTLEGNDVDEEVKLMETKDLEVDMPQTQDELRENVQLVESVTMMEKVNEVEVDKERDDGGTVNIPQCTISNLVVDISSISGVKRARVEHTDEEPSDGSDVGEEVKHMGTKDLEVDMLRTQDELRVNAHLVESVTMVEMVNQVEVDQERDGTVNLPECTISNLVVDVSSISGVKRARGEHAYQEPSDGNAIGEEVKHMGAKDLEVDMLWTPDEARENVQLVESVTMVEKVNGIEAGQEREVGGTINLPDCTISNLVVDVSPTSGVKRARMEHVDQEPSVRVVYNFLTRESKKKLMELMQQWSEWHAKCQPPKEPFTEDMENGEETYFPALHVGSKKSSTVSFWVGSQTSKGDAEYKLNSDSVPLYDRGCTLGLSLTDDSANSERIGALEASRCFNCGSYSHALRECPKPRDNAAIVNARKQHSSKRSQPSGSRTAVRYYEKPSGKYDDLRAGILGPETRESLGIGEHDPPPWLHRMREMGYPPGYLDDIEDEDQPSGITIFDGEEKIEREEGELAEEVKPEPSAKKMTVEFPGINAPIPENGDTRLWAAARPGPPQRPSRTSEPQRGPYHDQRWSAEHRDDGPPPPPGIEYGHATPLHGYSPRYGPYDHHSAMSRSPVMGRSLSDRGRRNLPYESSPGTPHSPYPYPGQHWQSPQVNSPTAAPEHRSHERPFNSSPDVSSHQSRERHEHEHRRHHRR